MLAIPLRSIVYIGEYCVLMPMGFVVMLIVVLHLFDLGRRTQGWFYKCCLLFPAASTVFIALMAYTFNAMSLRLDAPQVILPLWLLLTIFIGALSVDAIYVRSGGILLRLLMVFNLLMSTAYMFMFAWLFNRLVFRHHH